MIRSQERASFTERIEGYEAPIHRALWERIVTLGAPRMWAAVWLVLCLYAALVFLSVIGMRWALLPLVVWALGQGVLVLLTTWDASWDDIGIAQLSRRYKAMYEAG
jgi:type IV secretory pathway TrbD component